MEDKEHFTERRVEVDFSRCNRYDKHELSEEQIIDIARRAVIMAKREFNEDVGQAVTSKGFFLIGALFMGIMAWLTTHGYLK